MIRIVNHNPVLGFGIDLLHKFEKLIAEDIDSIESLSPHSIESFKSIITDVVKDWGDLLGITKLESQIFEYCFALEGDIQYYIPDLFVLGRNSFTIAVSNFKKWLYSIDYNISWSEFQVDLFHLLWNSEASSYGISRRQLEILRFYIQVFDKFESSNLEFIPPAKIRKQLFSKYKPIYLKSLNYNQFNKHFVSIVKKSTNYILTPIPGRFNLDILMIDHMMDLNEVDYILGRPIWSFNGQINRSNSLAEYSMFQVSKKFFYSNPHFSEGRVNNIHFFWNLDHYDFDSENPRSRGHLSLSPPWHTYDDLNHNKYTPDWQIIVDCSLDPLDNINRIEIQSNNQKLLNLNIYQDYLSSPKLQKMYQKRLYLRTLSNAIRGIIWLWFPNNLLKVQLPKILTFLKAWLLRGPIIEYKTGLFILSYFSHSILREDTQNELIWFFETFDIVAEIFIGANFINLSSLLIYDLPYSQLFDESSQDWNLSKSPIRPDLSTLNTDTKDVDKYKETHKISSQISEV